MTAAALAAALPTGRQADEKGWIDTFDVDKDAFVSTGKSRYFILEPGYELKLGGGEGLRKVTLFVTVLDETRIVDGVETRIVEEGELKGGSSSKYRGTSSP